MAEACCAFSLSALHALKRLVGTRAFNLLRRGETTLQVWRCSSPHNWFVCGKTGTHLWHSSERPRQLPDMRLFQIAEESTRRVVAYWGSDSGKPELTKYELKPEFRDVQL